MVNILLIKFFVLLIFTFPLQVFSAAGGGGSTTYETSGDTAGTATTPPTTPRLEKAVKALRKSIEDGERLVGTLSPDASKLFSIRKNLLKMYEALRDGGKLVLVVGRGNKDKEGVPADFYPEHTVVYNEVDSKKIDFTKDDLFLLGNFTKDVRIYRALPNFGISFDAIVFDASTRKFFSGRDLKVFAAALRPGGELLMEVSPFGISYKTTPEPIAEVPTDFGSSVYLLRRTEKGIVEERILRGSEFNPSLLEEGFRVFGYFEFSGYGLCDLGVLSSMYPEKLSAPFIGAKKKALLDAASQVLTESMAEFFTDHRTMRDYNPFGPSARFKGTFVHFTGYKGN